MLYIYQDKAISRLEADKIAVFFKQASGEKLYKHYNVLRKTTNRTGVEGREVKPFIANIEKVIPYLSGHQLLLAQDELGAIKLKL